MPDYSPDRNNKPADGRFILVIPSHITRPPPYFGQQLLSVVAMRPSQSQSLSSVGGGAEQEFSAMNPKKAQQDRLSTLPHSIILHILSLLPIQDAVRTVLLNKLFKTLSTRLLCLDFQHFFLCPSHSPDYHHFLRFVRNVLLRHESPALDKFSVNIVAFIMSRIDVNNAQNELESWINFALRTKVKVLDFITSIGYDHVFEWPHTEFISNSLVELNLEFLNIKSLTRVRLSSLKILRLIRMQVSVGVLEEFIQGCRVLRELEICNCYDLSTLRFNAVNVEKLSLDISRFAWYSVVHDDFGYVVKIDCSNLKQLDFTGFAELSGNHQSFISH